jgi:hypothetical protein
VPGTAEFERLYFELGAAGARVGGKKRRWPYRPDGLEGLLALACDMLRWDPRLLSVLVQLLLARWADANPLLLRRRAAEMTCPQALAVVLAFTKIASGDPELARYADYVSAGWPRLSPAERFFLDAARPGSRAAERAVGRNLAPYARWGFVGTERPIADLATRRTLGRYDARTRRRILARLVERGEPFSMADYLDALDHAVTRQQALADLRACAGLALVGRGRGAVWKRG